MLVEDGVVGPGILVVAEDLHPVLRHQLGKEVFHLYFGLVATPAQNVAFGALGHPHPEQRRIPLPEVRYDFRQDWLAHSNSRSCRSSRPMSPRRKGNGNCPESVAHGAAGPTPGPCCDRPGTPGPPPCTPCSRRSGSRRGTASRGAGSGAPHTRTSGCFPCRWPCTVGSTPKPTKNWRDWLSEAR